MKGRARLNRAYVPRPWPCKFTARAAERCASRATGLQQGATRWCRQGDMERQTPTMLGKGSLSRRAQRVRSPAAETRCEGSPQHTRPKLATANPPATVDESHGANRPGLLSKKPIEGDYARERCMRPPRVVTRPGIPVKGVRRHSPREAGTEPRVHYVGGHPPGADTREIEPPKARV
jgi:hypothetical protein